MELINNNLFPKTIYICYKNIDILKKYSEKWKILNPEYNIELYSDEKCKDFLLSEFTIIR